MGYKDFMHDLLQQVYKTKRVDIMLGRPQEVLDRDLTGESPKWRQFDLAMAPANLKDAFCKISWIADFEPNTWIEVFGNQSK